MYCKNCGNLTIEIPTVCPACGFDPLTERNHCQECGSLTKTKQLVCLNCQASLIPAQLNDRQEQQKRAEMRNRLEVELNYLSSYYQREFLQIFDSNEEYKGRWNWSAFLFGSIWTLSKGLWLTTFISLFLVALTFGFAAPIFWIMYGRRGNWIFYNKFVKNRQIGA